MILRTALCDLLGIEYPIRQSGTGARRVPCSPAWASASAGSERGVP